ncbi:hypothetical protein MLD38_026079 [Melastoma candidum]|uniref:Uncharacterized protein n=1 Tax=Melastoma candidum TaxID=119954 RepID=A0ACB9P462_9MYRT|nr:hypothetical protein MLD38_026079 [Melastoma candidum]
MAAPITSPSATSDDGSPVVPAAGAVGEDRVMATAQQILKSLNTNKEVREDMLLIFSSFDNRLSKITDLIRSSSEIEDRYDAAEKVILRYESTSRAPYLPWEDSPQEASEYYSSLDEILLLCDDPAFQSNKGLVDRSDTAIQIAMSRLEDEFRHILVRNTVPLDADRLYGSIRRVSLSFASTEGEIDEDFDSFGEESSGHCFHERGISLGDDLCVDLINPDAVVELKEIAERMIRSGYEKECCQAYTSVRREALEECLVILGVEKLSIEDVQKIDWKDLDEKMKKWVQAVKVGVRVLLPCEKALSEQVFSGHDSLKDACFNETTRWCILHLLNFGEAVSICTRSPEKLFRILDMYDALDDAMPSLLAMIGDEFESAEAKGVLAGLGTAARGTFAEFEKAVQGETSRKPMQGGEIHPLTRYVMNYLKLLVVYSETLNSLLETSEDEPKDVGMDNNQEESMSPIARHLFLLISSLEKNLEEKSKQYEDGAMQYIFLMNNILYIVQKVKDSELKNLLGDDWVRKRRGLIRQHATGYLRASWSKALACLKDDGISGGSSSNAGRMALKDRFKNFNACFEEIYRIQTAWKVPDEQLREELRLSISEKVIPAYRSFVGRFGSQLESGKNSGKYIKYTPEDLENYLSDLFEGSPGVLHHMRRKSS